MSAEEEDAVQTELADLEKQLVSLIPRIRLVIMLRNWYRAWSRKKHYFYQMPHGLNSLPWKIQVRRAQLVLL